MLQTMQWTLAAFAASAVAFTATAAEWPPLPEAVNSFGAITVGDHVYVYSGHTGMGHAHSRANLSKTFLRLDWKNPAAWETLPAGPALQGLPLVAHRGRVIRVGGLDARNATADDEEDLHSTDEVAAYDPAAKKWTALPPLPSARSSHDAAVFDDKLYVVGGWTLNQPADSTWHDDVLVLDLAAEKADWKVLCKAPFKRRALSAAAVDGSLYAIGGLAEKGGISLEVDRYDLASGTWSKGPTLPDAAPAKSAAKDARPDMAARMNGFGSTAVVGDGALYLGVFTGEVLKLDAKADRWTSVATLAPGRFFHRLTTAGAGRLLTLGGSSTRGIMPTVEAVDLGPTTAAK
ncbi:MAG: Kelch repeat-containing protein [Planctomycetia bacterium]